MKLPDAINAKVTSKLVAKVAQADARIGTAVETSAKNASRVVDRTQQKLAAQAAKVAGKATAKLNLANTLPPPPAVAAPSPAGIPVVSGGPQSVQSLQTDIARALGYAMAPAWMFGTAGGATWSVADLQALATTIGRLSPTDRQALSHTAFQRIKEIGAEDGKPDFGRAEFGKANSREARSTVSIADVASIGGVVGDVAAHEIGHIVMGGGKWDSNVLREFGKLSHWVRTGPPETLVDGYDEFYRAIDLEPADYPKNAGNFVSDHARESAGEDYAESYRVYLSNPGDLLAKAPEKFLFLNARSGKYSVEQIKGFANVVGVDLPIVMGQLAHSGLRADTLANLATKNGLEFPPAGSGAGDAVALIGQRAGDPAFAASLRTDPRAALGDAIWGRLTPAEQALFAKPGYAGGLLASAVSNAQAPADTVKDQDVDAWKAFMLKLLNDPPSSVKVTIGNAQATPQSRFDTIDATLHDPQFWARFTPETRAMFESAAGKTFLAQMASDETVLDITRLAWNTRHLQGQYVSADVALMSGDYLTIREYLQGMGPADFDALSKTIRRGLDPATADRLSDANRTLASTGHVPFAGPIPGM